MTKVEWVPIGDVLARDDTTVAVSPSNRYRMLGLLNRGRGLFERGTVLGSERSDKRLGEVTVGQLVFSKLFAWEGSVSIADRTGWVSSEFPRYNVFEQRASIAYIAHVVASDNFVARLSLGTTGLGQRRQRVNPTTFESIKIPLPDLATQNEIADRLDRVGTIARKAAPLGHGDLRSARGRILAESLVGATTTRLGSVLDRRHDTVDVDPGSTYSMLGMRNQGRGAFDAGVLPGNATQYKRLNKVLAGDLIYLKLGAWEGAFGIVPDQLNGRYTSPEFVSFALDPAQVDRHYLESLVTWSAFAVEVGGLSKGTNLRRRRLTADSLEALQVPLPSLADQQVAGAMLRRLRDAEALVSRRSSLAAALLPAARNDEFDRLLR